MKITIDASKGPAEPVKPFNADEKLPLEATELSPVFLLFDALHDLIEEHDHEEDDATAIYAWAQQITNQISKAQGGKGPLRDRYLDIAELAIAAVLSIDRNAARG